MTSSFHLQFTIYQFTLICHLSFNKWPMLDVKSLKIANCKLKTEPTAGGVSC